MLNNIVSVLCVFINIQTTRLIQIHLYWVQVDTVNINIGNSTRSLSDISGTNRGAATHNKHKLSV